MRNPERRSNVSFPGSYYAQDHLMNGHKLGFICSSDNHFGQGGRRHGGIAAVFAAKLKRDNIFDAIKNSHCYGTTGERILLDFSIDGIAMGQEEQRHSGDKLKIKLNVWGTDLLLRVEVLRFRVGIDKTFTPILSEMPCPESTDGFFIIEDKFEAQTIYYAALFRSLLNGRLWFGVVLYGYLQQNLNLKNYYKHFTNSGFFQFWIKNR